MESSPDLVHPIRSVGWQQSGGSRDGQPDATDRQSREEGNSVRYWCCSTVRQLSYCRGKWPSTRAVCAMW